jgi:hypothetical protein
MPVSSMSGEVVAPGISRSLLRVDLLRIPLLLLLFSWAGVYEAYHLTAFRDYDIWWHLRTGIWILQNHAVPHTALFTQYSSQPWIAYSWGFDLVTAVFYKLFGLRALPILQVCFKVAFAVVAFLLARGSFRNFLPAAILSAIGQYAITDFKVRPGSLSILLLGILLIVLFQARRTGEVHHLRWLPLLFLFWANLHIQFVYGLFVTGLFAGVVLLESLACRFSFSWFAAQVPSLNTAYVVAVTGACVLATLITPYTYHTYQVAWQYAHSTAVYSYILEMHAMNFYWPEHYVRLLLVMAACFALGQRGSRNLFAIVLLATSALLGFHQQRDTWFMVLVSIAVIGDAWFSHAHSRHEAGPALSWERIVVASLVTVLLIVSIVRYVPSSREALLLKIGESFPVKACNYILENHLPGHIFNPLNWGGFLTWYLPDYPVAIDGRTDLYGDEITTRQYKIWDGELSPGKEPTLVHARTLLVGSNTGLAAALRESPGYRLAYDDGMAAVFERMVGPDIGTPQ